MIYARCIGCKDVECAKGCKWPPSTWGHLDINSLDPLERQGDDSRDFQRDCEDERQNGWSI